jgi:chromate transporter
MLQKSRTGLWKLFITWFTIGIQSFGGGSSTLYLIHQACIKQGWLTEDEFVRTWALVQVSPGINLVKLTVMIGHHLRGWSGLVVSMLGLLLPSATATVLMTAGFAAIRNQPAVQAAMKGILPATIGLSLAMSVQMAQPIFTRAYKEGPLRLALHSLILAGAMLLMMVSSISPVLLLLLAGAVTMALLVVIPIRHAPTANQETE